MAKFSSGKNNGSKRKRRSPSQQGSRVKRKIKFHNDSSKNHQSHGQQPANNKQTEQMVAGVTGYTKTPLMYPYSYGYENFQINKENLKSQHSWQNMMAFPAFYTSDIHNNAVPSTTRGRNYNMAVPPSYGNTNFSSIYTNAWNPSFNSHNNSQIGYSVFNSDQSTMYSDRNTENQRHLHANAYSYYNPLSAITNSHLWNQRPVSTNRISVNSHSNPLSDITSCLNSRLGFGGGSAVQDNKYLSKDKTIGMAKNYLDDDLTGNPKSNISVKVSDRSKPSGNRKIQNSTSSKSKTKIKVPTSSDSEHLSKVSIPMENDLKSEGKDSLENIIDSIKLHSSLSVIQKEGIDYEARVIGKMEGFDKAENVQPNFLDSDVKWYILPEDWDNNSRIEIKSKLNVEAPENTHEDLYNHSNGEESNKFKRDDVKNEQHLTLLESSFLQDCMGDIKDVLNYGTDTSSWQTE